MLAQRPGEPVAAVHAAGLAREAALVQQHHDGVDAAALEHSRVAVGGGGLVEEPQPARERRGDVVGRALERHPDEADLHRPDLPDRERREDPLAGAPVDDVGGQEREVGALVRRAVGAAVDRVAAAALEAAQLSRTLVELVVADRRDVEPDHVHRLDRGLVVEERGEQRAAAHEVAGGDHERMAGALAQRPDVRGEVLGAAGREALVLPAHDRARRRRLQVAVEVVDPEQLDAHRRGRWLARLLPLLRERRSGEQQENGGCQYGDPVHCPTTAKQPAPTEVAASS